MHFTPTFGRKSTGFQRGVGFRNSGERRRLPNQVATKHVFTVTDARNAIGKPLEIGPKCIPNRLSLAIGRPGLAHQGSELVFHPLVMANIPLARNGVAPIRNGCHQSCQNWCYQFVIATHSYAVTASFGYRPKAPSGIGAEAA